MTSSNLGKVRVHDFAKRKPNPAEITAFPDNRVGHSNTRAKFSRRLTDRRPEYQIEAGVFIWAVCMLAVFVVAAVYSWVA